MKFKLKLFPQKVTSSRLMGLVFLCLSPLSNADVVVLIHGYMGSPASWENSRINDILEDAGWQRGGLIVPETQAFYRDPMQRVSTDRAKNVSFVIDMPWMRPIDEQADYLDDALEVVLQMRPKEPVTLVGHSAGALAARLWLVENYKPNVVRLISIAAPNLGTERAFDALDLTDPTFAPLDAVRNMFGGKLYNTVRRSRKLVRDFTPPSERNPNVLYWLNQQ